MGWIMYNQTQCSKDDKERRLALYRALLLNMIRIRRSQSARNTLGSKCMQERELKYMLTTADKERTIYTDYIIGGVQCASLSDARIEPSEQSTVITLAKCGVHIQNVDMKHLSNSYFIYACPLGIINRLSAGLDDKMLAKLNMWLYMEGERYGYN